MAAAAPTKETPATQPVTLSPGKIAKMGGKMREFKLERDAAQKALEDAQKELAALKAKVADPDEQTKELAALKQQLRDKTAYDRFAELAAEKGAKPAAVKHLWKLAEYQADKDEPDDAKLAELLDGLKTEADFAFEAADSPAAAAPPAKTRSGLEIPATAARPAGGGRADRNTTVPRLTSDQMADPKFMLDPRNKEYIKAAVSHASGALSGGPVIR